MRRPEGCRAVRRWWRADRPATTFLLLLASFRSVGESPSSDRVSWSRPRLSARAGEGAIAAAVKTRAPMAKPIAEQATVVRIPDPFKRAL